MQIRGLPGGGGVVLPEARHDVNQGVDSWKTQAERLKTDRRRGEEEWREGRTFLPHVHLVGLPVAVFGLTDAAVGQGVAGVVGVHAEVEVVAGVRHGELEADGSAGSGGIFLSQLS